MYDAGPMPAERVAPRPTWLEVGTGTIVGNGFVALNKSPLWPGIVDTGDFLVGYAAGLKGGGAEAVATAADAAQRLATSWPTADDA